MRPGRPKAALILSEDERVRLDSLARGGLIRERLDGLYAEPHDGAP